MNSRFSIILVALVVIFGGILVFNKKEDKAETGDNSKATSHMQGNTTSKVTLTEYGDFECPGCGAYYPTLKQVEEKYKDKIAFQFRNFPLSIHKNAMVAHRAAEAANKQNKFWEMHDMLFESQSTWNGNSGSTQAQAATIFEGFAQQLGLDMAKYKTDRDSADINDIIQADIAEGRKLNLTGTPSFALNGKRIETPNNTVEAFSKVIDEALKAN